MGASPDRLDVAEARSPQPVQAGTGARGAVSRSVGVLALQRAIGNRATSALLRAGGLAVQRDAPGWANPSQSVSPTVGVLAQGAQAAMFDPWIAAYAFGEAETLAQQNVHRHLGDRDLPPRHSVEPGSARVGPGNALRHCTWAAAVGFRALRRRPPASPHDRAEVIDTARSVLLSHEPRVPPGWTRPADSQVDIHNNEEGLAIAGFLAEAPRATTEQLLHRCRDALDDGRLQMLDPAGTGRIIPTTLWQRFGRDAWHGENFSGVRPGVPPEQAERTASQQALEAGDVGRLADVLLSMTLRPSGQALRLMSALAIIDQLSGPDRRRALQNAVVVAFLGDAAVPASARNQVRAALERSAG